MIECVNVSKVFRVSRLKSVHAVQSVNLMIEEGAFLTLSGPSGSGKSSLLGLILGMTVPTKGRIRINKKQLSTMNERELTSLRKSFFGFVHQFPILHPSLTAIENVILPSIVTKDYHDGTIESAMKLLLQMGLKDRFDHFPRQLSGGEAKRVAIARSLIMDPPVIVADEPTASLDREAGMQVLRLFKTLHSSGKTVILASHDPFAKKISHESVTMNEGKLIQHRMKQNDIGNDLVKETFFKQTRLANVSIDS